MCLQNKSIKYVLNTFLDAAWHVHALVGRHRWHSLGMMLISHEFIAHEPLKPWWILPLTQRTFAVSCIATPQAIREQTSTHGWDCSRCLTQSSAMLSLPCSRKKREERTDKELFSFTAAGPDSGNQLKAAAPSIFTVDEYKQKPSSFIVHYRASTPCK